MAAIAEQTMWKWWLGMGAAVVALYVALPGTALSDAAYLGTALSAPVAIVVGIRRFRPIPRTPWMWLAASQALLFVAELVWFALVWTGRSPFPSVADILFLASYPCLAAGLALLMRHRTVKGELGSLLDAAIVSIGAGIVTWVLVVGPVLDDIEATPLERMVSVAYPVLYLLVLVVLARMAFSRGTWSMPLILLTLGLVLDLGADIRYRFEEMTGTYAEYGLVDGSWMLAYILVGTAALHPSMAALTRPEGEPPEQVSLPRLVTLTVASLTAPWVLLVQWLRKDTLEIPVIASGAIAMFVLVVVRVSELGRLVAVTRARGEARFRSLVHNATDVIIVLDADGTITYASPAINRMWHHRSADVIGTPFSRLLHADDIDSFAASFAVALASDTIGGIPFRGRIWSPAQQWRSFEALTANLLDDPSVNGVVLTCRDTTDRVTLEAQLTHQAFHDALTGLANRALFVDRVEHALGNLARRQRMVAVLFIDLDDFKTVNDGLGHGAGDALLIEVGRRLMSNLRPGDTAARLGGDEFSVLVEDAADDAVVTAVAQRLVHALQQPFVVNDVALPINASVGIAARDTADSAQLLIRDADIAMYAAKTNGKGRCTWFKPTMRAQAVDRWELRADLATALPHNEFFVVYQPIVDLVDDRIVGAEALLRWRHPTRGIIAPLSFVATAEQTGMITEIGDWVLHTAARDASRWLHQAGPARRPYVSVNVSAIQLRDHAIVTRVTDALARSGLPADALMLELTESTLMDDVDRTRAVFGELKDLGVTVAVDDFGTGYSSLAYLRQFPVDLLKIDRSFVSELRAPIAARSLAEDIITLARALDIATVAEGIETPQQLTRLRSMDCAMGQGFYLGRPMSLDDLAQRLREQTTAPGPQDPHNHLTPQPARTQA